MKRKTHSNINKKFLSIDSSVISTKELKENYSKNPEIDRYGYRNQLKGVNKKYVICLNATKTIDLITMHQLFGGNKSCEREIILLADSQNRIIQSNDINIMQLMHRNLLKFKNLHTILDKERRRARLNDNFHQKAPFKNLAYDLFTMRAHNYRQKDFEAMLLPHSNNRLLDYNVRHFLFYNMKGVRYKKVKELSKELEVIFPIGITLKKRKYLFTRLYVNAEPIEDYLNHILSDRADRVSLYLAYLAIEPKLDILDHWDVSEEETQDYYFDYCQEDLRKKLPEY